MEERRDCGKRGDWDHDWKDVALGVCWCKECGVVSFTGGKRLTPRRLEADKPIIIEKYEN